ncbi:MAG: NAD(P)H-dependent oxidoreductase subunit E [Candidatus Dormibacteraeota bacterium]|jgi:NADH-quinone oxidoreductase subunit E|nr:NAD(P)H-dependent oxidoreductase subunit E [Candidatus Dormibacteraeota bacterium]
MTGDVAGEVSQRLSGGGLERIRAMAGRYPSPRSAVLPALWAIQDELGYLPPWSIELVAEELALLPGDVEAVASFYSMYFNHKPGRHVVQVCLNVSCGLRGSDELVAHLRDAMRLDEDGTTPEGDFTIEGTVECLGACGGAPMMQVDRYTYENLTPQGAVEILEKIRSGKIGEGR